MERKKKTVMAEEYPKGIQNRKLVHGIAKTVITVSWLKPQSSNNEHWREKGVKMVYAMETFIKT